MGWVQGVTVWLGVALSSVAAADPVNDVTFDGTEASRRDSAVEMPESDEQGLIEQGYVPIGMLEVRHRGKRARPGRKGSVAHLLAEAAAVGGDAVVVIEREVEDAIVSQGRHCTSWTYTDYGGTRSRTCTGGFEERSTSVPFVKSRGRVYRHDPEAAEAMAAWYIDQQRAEAVRQRLHAAIETGDSDAVDAVIAEVSSPVLLLSLGIISQRVDVVRDALAKNVPPAGLEQACWRGDPAIVEALLDAGAPIEGEAGDGRPLDNALSQLRTEVAKLLIARGADVDRTRAETTGDVRYSDLGRAIRSGDPELVEAVLGAGARLSKPQPRLKDLGSPDILLALETPGNLGVVQVLVAHGAEVVPSNVSAVVYRGDLEMIRYILDHGGDARYVSRYGTGALDEALKSGEGYDCASLEIVRLLVERGADPTGYEAVARERCGEEHANLIAELAGRK